jgi:NADPH-dependent ferric siderophore reductase
MTAKTATERVYAMRQRRADLGLVRLDVYAHKDDHPAIKALTEKLTNKRMKEKTK